MFFRPSQTPPQTSRRQRSKIKRLGTRLVIVDLSRGLVFLKRAISKPRRERQRERRSLTKHLMSETVVLHVRY